MEKRFERVKIGDAAISAVTFGELCNGAAQSQAPAIARSKLDELAAFLPVLMFDDECARAYGEVRAALAAIGRIIGTNDLSIAAHARRTRLVPVTRNEREFKRVPGLKVENWVKNQP